MTTHGTYTRAVASKCGCKPCRGFRHRVAIERSQGVLRRVDATQSRAHLERLLNRGWTQSQIAAAAGFDQSTVSVVISGRHMHVHRDTAAAILNIRLDQMPPIPRGFIDATGTRRRLQALATLGYTLPGIARRIGVSNRNLYEITVHRWGSVRQTTATGVARVYRELSTQPARQSRWSEQARAMAAANGWHGPMAWDDIDDPACKPQTVHDETGLKRNELADLRRQEVHHLTQFSVPPEEIAARLNIGFTTVTGILAQQRKAAASPAPPAGRSHQPDREAVAR